MKKILFCVAIFVFSSSLWAAEYLMTFTRQSGGLTGQTTMTTTDGTIWQSNCPVYANGSYYYMQSMFDGIHAEGAWSNGWLANGVGIPGPHYLTVTFTELRYVAHINTFPIMYPGYWSDAHVYVSTDGSNFNFVGDVICGNHQYDPQYWNYSVDLTVAQQVKQIKYVFFNEQYGSGQDPVIIEMQIYGNSTPAVPEPTTALLGLLGILGYAFTRFSFLRR